LAVWPAGASLNSPWDDTQPGITSDGLEFFFTSNRPGSLGGRSLWQATRASVNDPWGAPVALAGIDSANHEQSPSLTDDGLILLFASNRTGNFDIYLATRASRQAPFGAPVRVDSLSGPNHDIGVRLANLGASGLDGLVLVTVMIDGRAVILSAQRNTAPTGQGTSLDASSSVGPGEILSVQLRSPAGHFGVVALGSPMPPIQTGFGLLALDPGSMVVLDVFVQAAGVHLAQVVLPANPQLQGVAFGVQGLSGTFPDLTLTNAVLRTVQ
jgi:hypothetical protein